MEQGQEWVKRLTRQVGERVAFYRARRTDDRGRKMTAQALADRCAELGLPIGRPAVAKLESGIRQAITVAEVQVLAEALGVAPVDLLFPVGYVKTVEVLPGQVVDSYGAFEWFIGNSSDPADPREWPQMGEDSPTMLWANHLMFDGSIPTYLRELDEARTRMLDAKNDRARERAKREVELVEGNVKNMLGALRRTRAIMRNNEMILPDLHPETLAALGDDDGKVPRPGWAPGWETRRWGQGEVPDGEHR